VHEGGAFLCDVCEQPFPADRTVRLHHRGRSWEVDLCEPHVHKLDKVLAQFLDVAREFPDDDGVDRTSAAAGKP
jgi:hypothetical protein